MKLFSLFGLLLSLNAFAAHQGAPFEYEVDNRFDALEGKYHQQFVYDVAVKGGDSTADVDLGIVLPAGSVVTDVLLYINTQFADNGTGSVQLYCQSDQDLMAYNDLTGLAAGAILFGGISPVAPANSALIKLSSSSVSGANTMTSACHVKARVHGGSGFVPETAGKLTGVIGFFIK